MDEINLSSIESKQLGTTNIRIPSMGAGTWQWGERKLWGYGTDYREVDVRAAFQAYLAAGIDFFDTSEWYGHGRSERLLGKFMRESGQTVVVATKFDPFSWRRW
jgi:aryl-alcohol dehydrogenase-like predicted oxidoreductase